mmetsp:Transcript_9712/g.39502  ORF Transcript_9712/g.39502 Transcript_9712/m.39502 type:complete len:331 (-) Transcript_9712:73-1065(-)
MGEPQPSIAPWKVWAALGAVGGGLALWYLAQRQASIPSLQAASPPALAVSNEDLLVFFDLETTIPATDLLEFGAVALHRAKYVEVERYQTLVYSEKVTKRSTDCNHITRAMAESAPKFEAVAQRIFDMLDGRIWAGHNLKAFDCKVIDSQFTKAGLAPPKPLAVVDTLPLLKKKFGQRAGNLKLARLGEYFGLGEEQHRSIDDVLMNIEVLKCCSMNLLLEAEFPEAFPVYTEEAKPKPAPPAQERGQTGGAPPAIQDAICQAMAEGREVWISYNGGTVPGRPRPIRPVRWQRRYKMVKAVCGTSNIEKSFSMSKITEVRPEMWLRPCDE